MSRRTPDVATRARLIDAATRLFARHGFGGVTIRDVCAEAQANIAAVNYHFPGKAGLYDEVVERAIRAMQAVTEQAREAGHTLNAEGSLRAYVHELLARASGSDDAGWSHQVLLRELSEPTHALPRLTTEVIAPRRRYLGRLVADLLGCHADDPRVARCAFSIDAQCLAMMNVAVSQDVRASETIGAMAEHITEFSLAGLWALARA